MLQHVVLFKFPQPLDPAAAAEMHAAVAAFPDRVGELTRLRFGSDVTGDRTQGYQYLLFTEFPDEAALDRYRVHPVHQDFLAWLREREATVLAFDYPLDESTVLLPE